MKLMAIVKVIDEDSGFVVREGDRINLELAGKSLSQELAVYECTFQMAVSTNLERLCEEEKRRKILQKREEEKDDNRR